MEILKFTLKGRTAFFKMPDVNSYLYFSYGNIHKPALLGLLGAVMGYKGYNHQEKNNYPEYYEKLKDLKISIVPNSKMGDFSKKVQIFNNSVGYASSEEGGNLIVKEYWLENVSWDIFIKMKDTLLHKDLKERIINFNFEYTIYLGKNDHLADIENVEILEGEKFTEESTKINSLFLRKSIGSSIKENISAFSMKKMNFKNEYKYEEKLPLTLNPISNQYETENFIFTNIKYEIINKENFIKIGEKILEFY